MRRNNAIFSNMCFLVISKSDILKMSEDKVVYEFENITLYQRDLSEIENGDWINDTSIHLAGRKIELSANSQLNKDEKKNILLIPPSTFQLMRFVPLNVAKEFTNHFNAKNASLVFVPFTNTQSIANSGSHWSMILWVTESNTFYLLDSMGNANYQIGQSCVNKLAQLYDIEKYEYKTLKVPQQQNCVDCGVFVIAFMEHIAKECRYDNISDDVSQTYVTSLRADYYNKFCK